MTYHTATMSDPFRQAAQFVQAQRVRSAAFSSRQQMGLFPRLVLVTLLIVIGIPLLALLLVGGLLVLGFILVWATARRFGAWLKQLVTPGHPDKDGRVNVRVIRRQ